MITQHIKDALFHWTVPPGFKDLIKQSIRSQRNRDKTFIRLCATNVAYKNIHQGQRCFIVCSGPSIKKQNLLPLKNEITFFVSSGFLHPDYSEIKPDYHCTPEVLFTHQLTKEKYIEWFNQMDNKIGNAQLFVSAADVYFIKQNNLFSDRPVSYLNMGLELNLNRKEIYDISKKILGIMSVPIMAIMIAMYMGCREIYLLGVEVDDLWSGEYKHFYDDEKMKNDIAVNDDGKITIPLIERLGNHYILWQQFHFLKNIAEANNIEIFNATHGGALDVYKRVNLEELFNKIGSNTSPHNKFFERKLCH